MIVPHYSECVLVCFFHTLFVPLREVHQIATHAFIRNATEFQQRQPLLLNAICTLSSVLSGIP